MSGWFPGAAGAATSSRRRQPDVLEIVPDHRRPDAADAATDCVEGRPAVEERVGGFIVEKPPQLAIELVAAGGVQHPPPPPAEAVPPRGPEEGEDCTHPVLRGRAGPLRSP